MPIIRWYTSQKAEARGNMLRCARIELDFLKKPYERIIGNAHAVCCLTCETETAVPTAGLSTSRWDTYFNAG